MQIGAAVEAPSSNGCHDTLGLAQEPGNVMLVTVAIPALAGDVSRTIRVT